MLGWFSLRLKRDLDIMRKRIVKGELLVAWNCLFRFRISIFDSSRKVLYFRRPYSMLILTQYLFSKALALFNALLLTNFHSPKGTKTANNSKRSFESPFIFESQFTLEFWTGPSVFRRSFNNNYLTRRAIFICTVLFRLWNGWSLMLYLTTNTRLSRKFNSHISLFLKCQSQNTVN